MTEAAMPIHTWEGLDPTQVLALKGYGGETGVYVRSSVLRVFKGDGNCALLFTQLLYWSQTDAARENDGWFYLTTQRVTAELGMSRYVQERIRDKLLTSGLVEYERRGMPAKGFYRLNLDKAIDLLADQHYVTKAPSRVRETPEQEGGDAADQCAGKPQTSVGENPKQECGKTPYIVNREENTEKKQLVNPGVKIHSRSGPKTAGRGAYNPPENVLGADFDKAVAYIRNTYPLNGHGVKPTEGRIREYLHKTGNVTRSTSAEDRATARAELKAFMKAVKNFRDAVNTGQYQPKFVFTFDRWAGLGAYSKNEPEYRQWVDWAPPPPKKPAFVV